MSGIRFVVLPVALLALPVGVLSGRASLIVFTSLVVCLFSLPLRVGSTPQRKGEAVGPTGPERALQQAWLDRRITWEEYEEAISALVKRVDSRTGSAFDAFVLEDAAALDPGLRRRVGLPTDSVLRATREAYGGYGRVRARSDPPADGGQDPYTFEPDWVVDAGALHPPGRTAPAKVTAMLAAGEQILPLARNVSRALSEVSKGAQRPISAVIKSYENLYKQSLISKAELQKLTDAQFERACIEHARLDRRASAKKFYVQEPRPSRPDPGERTSL